VHQHFFDFGEVYQHLDHEKIYEVNLRLSGRYRNHEEERMTPASFFAQRFSANFLSVTSSITCWRGRSAFLDYHSHRRLKNLKRKKIHDVKTGSGKCCRLENYYMVTIGI
jgi:hypothetical protein